MVGVVDAQRRPPPVNLDFLTLLEQSITAWSSEAACADTDTNIFYAEAGKARSDPRSDILVGRARRICARCPVRRECLIEALTYEAGKRNPETGRWDRKLPFGVWGGVTPDERHDKAVRHQPGCRSNRCPGCRPLEDVLDDLDEVFRAEVARWLAPSECVA